MELSERHTLGKALRWFFLILLVIEVILFVFGIIPPNIAAIMVIATESTALVLALLIIVPATRAAFKKVRTHQVSFSIALQQEFKEAVPKPILFLFRAELGNHAALGRAIAKKRDVPKDATEIKYGSQFRSFAIFLLCLTPIEILAVELLFFFFKWPLWVHVIVLILTAYTLVVFAGMICSTVVYPHYASSERLVLRYMFYHTITIDTAWIQSVSSKKRECKTNKTIEWDLEAEGVLLALNNMKETNIVLRFNQPYQPIIDHEKSETTCMYLAFSVDGPHKAIAAIHSFVPPAQED